MYYVQVLLRVTIDDLTHLFLWELCTLNVQCFENHIHHAHFAVPLVPHKRVTSPSISLVMLEQEIELSVA